MNLLELENNMEAEEVKNDDSSLLKSSKKKSAQKLKSKPEYLSKYVFKNFFVA